MKTGRAISKKIDRTSQHGKSISQSIIDRDSSGMAHVIIPRDLDREVYIRRVYDSGRCIVVTVFDDPIRDTIIPKHLIQEISFPEKPGERGSLVHWISIPKTNQIVISGIILEEDETNPFKECVIGKVTRYKDYTQSDIVSSKDNTRVITIKDEEGEEGSITIQVTGNKKTAKVKLSANGDIQVSYDNKLSISGEEQVENVVGSKEGEVSSIVFRREGKIIEYLDRYNNKIEIKESQIMVDSILMKLGEEAVQRAVLGDILKGKLDELFQLLIEHKHPTQNGPSGPPLTTPSLEELKDTLEEILSERVKLE